MSTDIATTLAERGTRYGTFDSNANVSQDIKLAMKHTPNWSKLAPCQKEALEQIAAKISRILTGDPMYDDNWRDIAGYSTLVLKFIEAGS